MFGIDLNDHESVYNLVRVKMSKNEPLFLEEFTKLFILEKNEDSMKIIYAVSLYDIKLARKLFNACMDKLASFVAK